MDRLSDLPDHVLVHILSFLPTIVAARTSVVSRRFSRLWETSPFLDIDDLYGSSPSCFVDLANRTILHRNPPSPLLCLRLALRNWKAIKGNVNNNYLKISYIASLLSKAYSLGLRHLYVRLCSWIPVAVFPLITSLNSIELLSLEDGFLPKLFPSTPVNLKHLKSLHIQEEGYFDDFINRLVPELDSLEELHINIFGSTILDLKSVTVKTLELSVDCFALKEMRISIPSLKFFQLKTTMLSSMQWDWEMPMLTKATIQLENVVESNVEIVFKMLKTIAHAQELYLDITESRDQLYPFHTILLHGADVPTFVKLKELTLDICYHELNIQDLVIIIQHSPALQVLKLIHKPPFRARKDKKKKLWKSMLPRNAEGNYKYVYFEDLHIAGKKEEFLKKLITKQSSKRLKHKQRVSMGRIGFGPRII